ncbi:glycosyl hydrolase 53 family protein [Haloferula sp. A504]|uniref:glycosyl hydrolase 53 family protein n=1 Tax=Haloferula sp. A504 TaxID=3373601 RepID=UPI0031C7B6A1|nr:glycosyl hydrolase 53 family protein [Verrucomicrobiaceae bacterium E54]
MNPKFISAILLAGLLACQLVDGRDLIRGVDLSGIPEMERRGANYQLAGKQLPVLEIIHEAGFEMVRLRLFVEADGRWGAVNDLKHTLALAQRVKQAGFPILLALHYSDTWADPGNQSKPKAWAGLDFDSLVKQVHDYTREVLIEFKEAGVVPRMVQLGNEITPGMLWPDGRVGGEGFQDGKQWAQFARLLQAASSAVPAAIPDNTPERMIHIDRGGRKAVVKWFFTGLLPHDVDFEIIGLSHYPFLHNTMEDLRESFAYIDEELKLPFMVVETAHPHTPLPQKDGLHSTGYSHSPGGQYRYLRDLTRMVASFPNGRGIFYWFPEGIQHQWHGGKNALFDRKGAALPAIHAMRHEEELLAAEAAQVVVAHSKTTEPLNILLIFAEDLGLQVGPYGEAQIPTPGLDRLAREGTVFENAYCASATCSPSRASLFSGQYPHQTGHLGLADYGYSMRPGTTVFPALLKKAGYQTGISYKIHVSPEQDIRRHFDMVYDENRMTQRDQSDTKDWEAHLRYFRDFLAERDPEKPFYYQAQTHDTHEPFSRGKFNSAPDMDGYQTVKPGDIRPLDSFGSDIKRSDWLNRDLAHYYNSIQRVDALVAGLYQILEEKGLLESTVVVFSSDHGPSFGRGKLSVHELGVRVPLIARWPGNGKMPPRRVSSLVSLVDLAPTFMEIAGVVPIPDFAGRSLAGQMRGGQRPSDWRPHLVTEYHSHTTVDWWPMRSIRDGRHKLIVNLLAGTEAGNFILEGGRVQGEGDSADLSAGLVSGKGTIASAIYRRMKKPPRLELYNLARDPGETANLADDANYRPVVDKLLEDLRNWQQVTNDPFADPACLDEVTAAQIAKQREIRAYEAEHGKGSFWGKPVSRTDWSDLIHGTGSN